MRVLFEVTVFIEVCLGVWLTWPAGAVLIAGLLIAARTRKSELEAIRKIRGWEHSGLAFRAQKEVTRARVAKALRVLSICVVVGAALITGYRLLGAFVTANTSGQVFWGLLPILLVLFWLSRTLAVHRQSVLNARFVGLLRSCGSGEALSSFAKRPSQQRPKIPAWRRPFLASEHLADEMYRALNLMEVLEREMKVMTEKQKAEFTQINADEKSFLLEWTHYGSCPHFLAADLSITLDHRIVGINASWLLLCKCCLLKQRWEQQLPVIVHPPPPR